MSAERDELIRLAGQVPEEELGSALADLRKHVRPVAARPWPPAFFAGHPGEPDTSERVDEFLREGFGR